jgi:cyclic pyranopterin phosphate synthase
VPLVDSFGRTHDDLRVSVTDRCNLRCAYCMPEDPVWFPRDEILAYEEIHRVVRTAVHLGVRKVRITGGEPLLRRDLPHLVEQLAAVPGVEDLSLTTNGLLLEGLASELAAAGLRRVNVSLDSIVPERFERMTRRPLLDRVLRGLSAAAEAGLHPVKVNTVVVRGLNEDEIETFVAHARDRGWELRFIEFMPLENGETWNRDRVVRGEEIRKRIDAAWPLEAEPSGEPNAPATRYRFRDGKGAVGFINSVSEPFCDGCSRLRLTADGHLKVCLYDHNEVDVKGPLRAGASDEELERIIRAALAAKGRGGALQLLGSRSALPLRRTMHQIGG